MMAVTDALLPALKCWSALETLSSGVTGGGQSAPQNFWPGKFLLTYQEKIGKEKMGYKRRKIEKAKVKKFAKWGEDIFCIFLNGNFLPRKGISCWEKNQEKWIYPSEKFSCYAPDPKSTKGSTRTYRPGCEFDCIAEQNAPHFRHFATQIWACI